MPLCCSGKPNVSAVLMLPQEQIFGMVSLLCAAAVI